MIELSVGWKKQVNSFSKKFKWQHDDFDRVIDSSKSVSQDKSYISRYTIAALNRALDIGLSRKTFWDLSLVPKEYQKDFILAADIYMRGVSHSFQNLSKVEGKTNISILEDSPDSFLSKTLKERYVVCDTNLLDIYPFLKIDTNYKIFPSEKNKNIEVVQDLLKSLEENKSKEKMLVIGGGITCDIAAFAAHLLSKEFTLVPTTLLAMADASVGGKSGVNVFPYGKNLVGAFSFPKDVLVFPSWLRTLSQREFLCGASECLKHSLLIKDRKLFDDLIDLISEKKFFKLSSKLKEIIDIKLDIVSQDSFEQKGEREFLNFGHTLAHALEAYIETKQNINQPAVTIKHGEAVFVGIIFSLLVSIYLKHMPRKLGDEIISLLLKTKLLSFLENSNYLYKIISSKEAWDAIFSLACKDKKADSSTNCLPMILLEDFGKVRRKTDESTIIVDYQVAFKAWNSTLSILKLAS